MAAISSVSVEKQQLSFTGNYEGPLPGQRVHTIRRSELPPGTNTIQEIEDYINNVWLPRELRDVNGAIMGYAKIHVYGISGADVNWAMMQSTSPIPINWWPVSP
jgi:hypothetical protein